MIDVDIPDGQEPVEYVHGMADELTYIYHSPGSERDARAAIQGALKSAKVMICTDCLAAQRITPFTYRAVFTKDGQKWSWNLRGPGQDLVYIWATGRPTPGYGPPGEGWVLDHFETADSYGIDPSGVLAGRDGGIHCAQHAAKRARDLGFV
jgi:hypothetical protein